MESAPEETTSTSTSTANDELSSETSQPEPTPKPLKILFLSSDTGGGHRASAESLAKQFQLLYPGTTFILHDVQQHEGTPPYNSLVQFYKHLSAHPTQWKIIYEVSNSRAFEMFADAHLKIMCEKAVRQRIMSIDPDVVVSVHPLMCNVPILSCNKISQQTGRHLPMFTVVTDLGSAHCLWFANGVEKIFVGSDQIYKLAEDRGKFTPEKIVKIGLPIRHDFGVQAELLGDRNTAAGKAYQRRVRQSLDLPHTDRKTILLMGGGEGVGSLSDIVNALYVELVKNGMDALVLVVCGRNEELQQDLETRDWDDVLRFYYSETSRRSRALGGRSRSASNLNAYCGMPQSAPGGGCIKGRVTTSIRKILSSGSLQVDSPLAAPMLDNIPAPTARDGKEEEEEKKCADDVVDDTRNSSDEAPKQEENNKDIGVVHEDSSFMPSFEANLGQVTVVGLGFVTRMAEYMVAADVLVSKAGPGTISEAAALSLPVMLTSYLPGQEEGNIDFVVDGEFGAFISDRDPTGIAEELVMWLNDDEKMQELSTNAKKRGAPHAARDIAKSIGDSTLKWMEINRERAAAEEQKRQQRELDSDSLRVRRKSTPPAPLCTTAAPFVAPMVTARLSPTTIVP